LDKKDKFGSSELLKGRKIQVEFISANPTGPLTLANGRGGFGGDALANVLSKAGAVVEREYYVNDGGNQVTILGKSILSSVGLYKSNEDLYKGAYISDWAKDHGKEIEELKEKPFELGKLAAKDILDNLIKPAVANLGIKFDNWFSEEAMVKRGEVDEAIKRFEKDGLTKKEEGALWFKTTKYGDDKDRVLVKTDGEKTYFANDTAYHWDKFAKRNFDQVINFWGADHQGHVTKMQSAVEAMGFGGRLSIIIFQMVRLIKDGQEFKMSKRRGTYITTNDLLELIGGEVRDAADVARFFFLSRSFNTHMDFDLDLAREQSEKNPVFYAKYAYARLSGILRNAEKLNLPKANLDLLGEQPELDLIDQLGQLPSLLTFIATSADFPVHHLTSYILEIARKFHYFYDQCRVIDEENLELTAARLELVKATQIVLGITGQDLIGIEMPERM
jgi:arginyl-tRNA synthetase